MYVPIIIDPCSFYDYRYLWEYLKHLYHCYENGWPIVSTEEFASYRESRPVSNVYEEDFSGLHQYKLLSQEEESQVKKYFISQIIFDELEKQTGSKLGTRLFLLSHRYTPLEHEIRKILKTIQKDTGCKIKGILNWNAHFISVRYAAQKLGIPVITNEFSVRFPEYYPLGYFCKDDLYGSNEVKKMYERFRLWRSISKQRLLYREEIQALFLEKDYLNRIELGKSITPEYEIGIAGCHPLIPTLFAKSTYTDLELIEDVRKQYSEQDILFRKHPGDEPYQAFYTLKNQDKSSSPIDFILQCKRITAQGSNILVEAMLWGKQVYTRKLSPIACFAESNLAEKSSGYIPDDIVNFFFFVFLVPYSRLWNENYMDWRLHEKSIKKIYETNLLYYFRERNLSMDILDPEKNSYKQIIKLRLEGDR